MRHLNRLAVAAAALALAAAGLAATPQAAPAGLAAAPAGSLLAGAAIPGGFGSWSDLFATQDRMNAAGARVTALGRADARSGYAGIVADPTSRELRVYWKGAAPAELVATARSAVPVRVLPAAYSQRELQASAERLLAGAGDQVTMVAPRPDGAGLVVGTAGAVIPAAKYAAVPVTLETDVAPRAATRANDSLPWSGGARWVNATRGGACSTGFGIRQSGVNRVLSASHCAEPNHLAEDPVGQDIGRVGTEVEGNDVLVITAARGDGYTSTRSTAWDRWSPSSPAGSWAPAPTRSATSCVRRARSPVPGAGSGEPGQHVHQPHDGRRGHHAGVRAGAGGPDGRARRGRRG